MKYLMLLKLMAVSLMFSAQNTLPFKQGEHLDYTIFFGPLQVGSAQLDINDIIKKKNKTAFYVSGKGRTAFFFDIFFKVRDSYESYIDTETLLPLEFLRDVHEGGHEIYQNYKFYHFKNHVSTQSKITKRKRNKIIKNDSTYLLSYQSHDMLSAFFYARTFEKPEISGENNFYIPIFMDEEEYTLEIKYLYNEMLPTRWGNIECMVFKPIMQEGRIFEDGEQMKVWITNDENHLLMKVETKIWAGTIKAILSDYKSIKHPLSILK